MENSVKFGTSGLRGLADELLRGPAAEHAAAFCAMILERDPSASAGPILVGRDLRASSASIARQVRAAIEGSGFTSIDCGSVPTPALAHSASKRNASAIMVTGSHIPAERNGLKFYSPAGEITKAEEAAISALVSRSGHDATLEQNSDRGISFKDVVLDEWLERCRNICPQKSLTGLKVGVYLASSVATPVLARVLEDADAAVTAFGANEQFAPLDTEAVDDGVLEKCRRKITELGLDCMVSADPDGDRPLLIADDGKIVRGDLLGWMTARWLGADHVSTTVNANSAIQTTGKFAVRRTRIGSPHVIEAIQEAGAHGSNCAVGFEPNGGFLLGGDLMLGSGSISRLITRDSFLPILAILAQTANGKLAISDIVAGEGFHAAASGRLENFPGELSAALISELGSNEVARNTFFSSFGEVAAVDWTDGMRVSLSVWSNGDGGLREERIIHLRPSGNAPELRCYVEDKTVEGARALLHECLARIREHAGNR